MHLAYSERIFDRIVDTQKKRVTMIKTKFTLRKIYPFLENFQTTLFNLVKNI